jgi:cobalt-zinc-cadmium efflux system protein
LTNTEAANTQAHTHPNEHAHSHNHIISGQSPVQGHLLLTIAVTAGILLLEIIGGILANSLALLSDAGHVFTDLAALGLSLWALRLAARPATNQKTYGFHRFEILSALFNGVTLVVISLFIFFEAYQRLRNPQPVLGLEVFVIATLGLIGNGIGVFLLRGAGDNMNLRGAMLHLMGDAISSVGVILSGLVIMLSGWWIIDPLVSIGIGLIIIYGAVRLIDESVDVLLEGTPRHINLDQVIAAITSVPGVCSAHDVHIWCVTPQLCTMSGHIVLSDEPGVRPAAVLSRISSILNHDYGIEHTTIQIEDEHCGQNDEEWLAVK